jgi:hypothetical protein
LSFSIFAFTASMVSRGVLARAHHDDAAGHLALAVQLGDAAAHLRAHLHARHVAEAYRDTGVGGGQRNPAEIVERLQVPRCADHVLGLAQLEHRAPGLLVGLLDSVDHLPVRNVVGLEPRRVEHDLVLANHAAHGRDLGDVGDRLQLVLEEPVLERAQLGEVHAAAAVDERVFVHPSHAGRVGAEGRLGLRRQPRLHLVQVFEHPRARPIRIGAVVEEDVDERIAEERVAAHGLRPRHRQHRGGERKGHLVLDDLRRLAGICGPDDDLRVGQVRECVERRAREGEHSPPCDEHRGEQHQEAVDDRPADQGGDHLSAPCARPSAARSRRARGESP